MNHAVDIENVEAFYDHRYEGDYMSSVADLEVWRTREVLRGVVLLPGSTVVDYGCGRGVWAPVLRNAFPGARVVGIEISRQAVAAAQRAQPVGEFLVFDGQRAPFADGSIDLVFSYHVLEHVPHVTQTIADMVRLVRKEGHVCAILPCANRGSLEELATRLVENGVEKSTTGEARFFYEDPGHLRRMTSEQVVSLFSEHGCELVAGRYARHLAGLSYICSWTALIRRLFDPGRAQTKRAAVVLALIRTVLSPLAALLKVYHAGPRRLLRMLWAAPDLKARLLALGALLALPIGLPLGYALETALPRSEWRRTSGEPHAAVAQYFVFRKR